jgi:hypothetical protein
VREHARAAKVPGVRDHEAAGCVEVSERRNAIGCGGHRRSIAEKVGWVGYAARMKCSSRADIRVDGRPSALLHWCVVIATAGFFFSAPKAAHSQPQTASSQEFRLASQLAGGMWRFQPAVVGGCRARTVATFEMTFVVK